MENPKLFDTSAHEFFLFGLFASLSLLPFFTPFVSSYFQSLTNFDDYIYSYLIMFIFIGAHLPYFFSSRGSTFQVLGALLIGLMICNSFFHSLKSDLTWMGSYFIGALVFYVYISVLASISQSFKQKK